MARSSGLVLALDQGGHASRAIVFDGHGAMIARGACDVAESRPAAERVEQDPEELVRSLRRATKDAIRHLGRREGELVAAGLATQRSSVVAWDRQSGAALCPVLSWQDRRARDRIGELSEHADLVRAKTGLRLSPHYGASKLAWILANVPAAAAALREGRLCFGPLASFLAFRLLDERPFVADPANASRTLLWNVSTRRFDPELCDLFGVPIGALPRSVPTRAVHGTLDAKNRKIPLTILTGDQSAAVFAAGEPDPATAHVNFGTGAFVQRTFADASIDVHGLLKSVVFADESRTTFCLEGTVNGAGSAVQLMVAELGLHDVEPDLAGWLARETDPPLFLNGISGLGAPFWIPDFPTRFVGEGTREARLVAVLESVVFLVKAILDAMERALGAPRILRVSGGLSQLDGLCQRLADLARTTVERADDPEGTARGLAWLVHEDPAFVPRASSRFEARPNPALDARYERFRGAVEAVAR
jgi:glycerol kinase